MDELTNGRMDEWTNRRMDESANGRTDELANWRIGRSQLLPNTVPMQLAESADVHSAALEMGAKHDGMRGAPAKAMNAQAEVLKRRTFVFALAVIRFCRVLRRTWEGRELADQLFRSGTRIGADYRSACRGRSHADFTNKLGYVVEEADETVYWLDLIHASGVSSDESLTALQGEAGELLAIFSRSQMTAKENAERYARQRRDARKSTRLRNSETSKFLNS